MTASSLNPDQLGCESFPIIEPAVQFIAANLGLWAIVKARTTLGLKKLLNVMGAVIATKALKQVALVGVLPKLIVLHLRRCVDSTYLISTLSRM